MAQDLTTATSHYISLQEAWERVNQAEKRRSTAGRAWVESHDDSDRDNPAYREYQAAKLTYESLLQQFFFAFHDWDRDHAYDVFKQVPRDL